jgi:hypothetical protein
MSITSADGISFIVANDEGLIGCQHTQVWFSIGTGSMSSLVHTSGGASAEFCLGSFQASMVVARFLSVEPEGMYFMMEKHTADAGDTAWDWSGRMIYFLNEEKEK